MLCAEFHPLRAANRTGGWPDDLDLNLVLHQPENLHRSACVEQLELVEEHDADEALSFRHSPTLTRVVALFDLSWRASLSRSVRGCQCGCGDNIVSPHRRMAATPPA